MGVFQKIPKVIFLLAFMVVFNRCVVPECEDFECPDGQSCILQDSEPVCSDSTNDQNTDTGNVAGEACDTDSDCASGLVCRADLNGNDVCTAQ